MKQQRLKTLSALNPVFAVEGQDFLSRHGGPGAEELREEEAEGGRSGSWEMKAADGYTLRCEWLRTGDDEQLEFSEIAPGQWRPRLARQALRRQSQSFVSRCSEPRCPASRTGKPRSRAAAHPRRRRARELPGRPARATAQATCGM